MLNAGNPIGVMDSGIGGLTAVREFQERNGLEGTGIANYSAFSPAKISSILATVPTAPTATRPLTRSSS